MSPDVNLKLFKEEDGIQGIDYNIKKFAKTAPDAVKDLIKAKENKKLYEKLLAGKFIASTTVPILFMGFILPKLIFASSSKKIQKLREENAKASQNQKISFTQKDKFFKSETLSVENKPIARGELVIVNDRYGVKIEEVIANSSKSNEEELPQENDGGEELSQANDDFGDETMDFDENSDQPQEEQEGEQSDEDEFDYSDFELEDEDI